MIVIAQVSQVGHGCPAGGLFCCDNIGVVRLGLHNGAFRDIELVKNPECPENGFFRSTDGVVGYGGIKKVHGPDETGGGGKVSGETDTAGAVA